MAERWQQWMPHDIDAWQGSANVQALSDLAYRAVHNLLQDMWKQNDCALPVQDRELAKRSRVASRWEECRDEVLDYFDRTEDGKLTHRVLLKKWHEAQVIYQAGESKREAIHNSRVAAGRSGATKRWQGHSKRMANDSLTSTEQEQKQVQKQKPSRAKRDSKSPDPRHEPFKAAVMAYAAYKHVKLPWDASEANQLALLLGSAPDLTLKEFQTCLNHRARSPGTPHGDRPRIWLPHILKYQQGPLNEFNRTGEVHGTAKVTNEQLIEQRQDYLKRRAQRRMDSEPHHEGGLTETGIASAERRSLGPAHAPVLQGH